MYQCVESLLDRSTDFVRAAVAQRAQLGGVLVLDESLDLTPSAQPEQTEAEMEVSGRASLLPANEEQVDYDEVSIAELVMSVFVTKCLYSRVKTLHMVFVCKFVVNFVSFFQYVSHRR